MSKLIIDIETIGEDFEKIDKDTQDILTRWIKNTSNTEEEYKDALNNLKNELGFSPLTGEIVAIGVMDYEREQGVVYYQSPEKEAEETREGNFKLKPMREAEMLENFWQGANNYDEFITFNGRSFDIPYILIRSAIHQIEATRDLMSNRYVSNQRDAKHIDLFDQLSFYGAVRKPGSLHMWCRAFGITSPKVDGVTGDDVARLFKEKEYLKIAQYNTRDLVATKELYEYWSKFMRFS